MLKSLCCVTPIHHKKFSNVYDLIVWSAASSDVDTVLVDGRIVIQGGELQSQNETEIRERVQAIGKRILLDANLP